MLGPGPHAGRVRPGADAGPQQDFGIKAGQSAVP